MSLFEEAAELVRTGKIYVVDRETGDYREFPASSYVLINDLVTSGRFVPRLSLASALLLSRKIQAERKGKN